MLQFYFLTIFLNALTGYILFTGDAGNVLEFKSNFTLNDETFKLVLGILSVVTGLLKLLSPIEGDIPIIGDIVPAVTNFLSGFILIYEYYRTRSSMETSDTERIGKMLMGNKKIIGMAAIVAAILHFLFPKVLLL